MQTLDLKGFDGTTLLGFLAACGSLRLLDAVSDPGSVSLAFDRATGHARLRGSGDLRATLERALLDPALAEVWTFRSEAGEAYAQPSEMPAAEAKRLLKARLANSLRSFDARFEIDALSALVAGEPDNNEMSESTELRAVGGGQLQYFGQITALFEELTEANVRGTLDDLWAHSDEKGGLRLSVGEDRSYALRASDPSGEGAQGERAANILALIGHQFFPVLAQHGGATVGFDQAQNTVTWPLWEVFAGVATVASLLRVRLSAAELAPRGVFRVMRSRRVTRGKYRNFSPAVAIG